jgi:DNA-binding transcriptional LysR family regulator
MYKLHHLQTFQAVYRTGSFAIAARQLDYTPSAVSQQIAALEKDTGLALFEREAHGIRTTASAHLLFELSRQLLAGVDEFAARVRRLATGATGRIRVGSFPTASVRLIPQTLSAFSADHPGVEITLEEGEPDGLMDMLVDGDLDVVLAYEYGLCPRQWPDGVTTSALVREDLLLLRRAGGPRSVQLTQLSGQRWITSREGTAGSLSLTRLCASAGFTPAIAFRSNNYDVVRELVVSTGGVAIVPALGHVPDDRIAATRLPQPSAHRTVVAAYREGNTNPSLVNFLATTRRCVPLDAESLTALT